MTAPTLAQLARAEMDAHWAYTLALEAFAEALRLQLDGHRVEDMRQIQAQSHAAGQAWSEAMAATDAALEAAGRAPIGVATGRVVALYALIEEDASL